ncbi:glutathione S-transferase [Caulobacter sp. SLTY]|uniref:MAPEG family protein n=1 Tax=Caulobacter sp. SLTY TaxID=2683262 RepID=UPI00141364E5|nr:MAPEG family protein [Caulobacter sp. SLTY]NBB15999.1 glutathione S-transferase [Caulobacter sp. SLTY]
MLTESTFGHAAALWVGLNLLLLLVLSLLVVRQRQKHKVALGDDGIPELAQAIRAQGNAVEYIPAALIGLVVLEGTGAPGVLIHIGGLILLLGRVAHAIGLSNSGGISMLRTGGVVLTWLAYIFIIASCLFFSIG